MVGKLGDMAAVLRGANSRDKSEVYQQAAGRAASASGAGGEGNGRGVSLASQVLPADADLVAGMVCLQQSLDFCRGGHGVPGDRDDHVAGGEACPGGGHPRHDADDCGLRAGWAARHAIQRDLHAQDAGGTDMDGGGGRARLDLPGDGDGPGDRYREALVVPDWN